MLPLDGITVVSIEQAIAAPFCTRQLADLGARVIKIERPGGGDFARQYDERARGLSSHFVWVNRSKESIVLDLAQPEERRVLEALLETADVFVQNLAPGAVARLGFDHVALATRYPRLIHCDISGYGQTGPYRHRKAYDLMIQAETGFLSITGTEGEAAKAGCSIADIAAGMYAYSNILSALIERAQSGHGRHIDISMLECMGEWMGFPLYYGMDGAAPPARMGAAHATIYPYGPFSAKDGEVLLAVQNEREWTAFCQSVIMLPALEKDVRFSTNVLRSANRQALRQLVENVFGTLFVAEIFARLDSAQIAYANVNTIADLWGHPQLAARERWTAIETEAGLMPTLLPPGLSDVRLAPVPSLDADGPSIRRKLRMSGRLTGPE